MIRTAGGLALLPSLLLLLAGLAPHRDQVEARWEDSPPGERVTSAIEEVRPPPLVVAVPDPTPVAVSAPEPIVLAAVIYIPQPVSQPAQPVAPAVAGAITVAELYAALAASPWPVGLHDSVVRIAQCESKLQPNGIPGDHGLAVGLMQVRQDQHPALAAKYDLRSVGGSLAAAWEVYREAGSFRPWSCAA